MEFWTVVSSGCAFANWILLRTLEEYSIIFVCCSLFAGTAHDIRTCHCSGCRVAWVILLFANDACCNSVVWVSRTVFRHERNSLHLYMLNMLTIRARWKDSALISKGRSSIALIALFFFNICATFLLACVIVSQTSWQQTKWHKNKELKINSFTHSGIAYRSFQKAPTIYESFLAICWMWWSQGNALEYVAPKYLQSFTIWIDLES